MLGVLRSGMRLPRAQRAARGPRRLEPGLSASTRPDSFGTKRHFTQEDGGPALKLFLSEDVVAARLQRLSLDNDHSYGSSGFPKTLPQPWAAHKDVRSSTRETDDDDDDGDGAVIVDAGEFCMSSSKVLSVCPLLEESLRDSRPGNILPERLLHSLSSPCMDLVLWSPPTSQIQKLLRSLTGLLDSSQEKPSPATHPIWVAREHVDNMEL